MVRSPFAALVVPLGLAAVVGFVLPLQYGLVPPLLVLFGVAALVGGQGRSIDRGSASSDGWIAVLRSAPRMHRVGVVVPAVLASTVLAAVAAVAIGSLLVAFPAAIWAIAVVIGGGLVLAGLRPAIGRTLGALVLAGLVPVAASWGERFEAAGADARGWAQSGPILGIHPFQSTAIVVDGHGPFDLPLNDYVEPDGARGYSPEELAASVELALHAIAEVHFADGPAQAKKAFADARVRAVHTVPVRERLDRDPGVVDHPRFRLWSGSHGQRSRVELVCPGERNDPRPREADEVMAKMCPSKYASEASAGLGVTGRWPGYAEGRGNERVGLSNLLGWTRSDDAIGQAVVRNEVLVWAIALLSAALVLAIGRPPAVGEGIAMVGGATALLASLALLGASPFVAGTISVGMWSPAAGAIDFDPTDWLVVFAVSTGLVHLVPRSAEPPRATSSFVPALWLRFVVPAVVTLLVASSLSALSWVGSEAMSNDPMLAPESFVAGLASAIALRSGLDVQTVEAVVAAISCVVLLGLLVALVSLNPRSLASGWSGRTDGTEAAGKARWALLVALPAIVLLLFWRKGEDLEAFIPGAVALSILLGSVLQVVVRTRQGRLPNSILGLHLFWSAIAVTLLGAVLGGGPPSWLALSYSAVGLLVVLGGLALVVGTKHAVDGPKGADNRPKTAAGGG